MLQILDKYRSGSGQMINGDKSAIFFSKNCSIEMKEPLAEKYLGLPTEVGRGLSETFEFLRAQVRGRIESWCGRECEENRWGTDTYTGKD